MGKIAASVLLKLFINENEKCQYTDNPKRMSGTLFSNVNNIPSLIPNDQKTWNDVIMLNLVQLPLPADLCEKEAITGEPRAHIQKAQ